MMKFTKRTGRNCIVGTFAVYLVSLTLSPTPVRAQGVFNMGALTNTMSMGAVVKSESERAKGKSSLKNNSIRSGQVTRNLSSRRTLGTFKPSSVARKRNIAAFIKQLSVTDPVNAAAFKKTFATTDVFSVVNRQIYAQGLSTNNLADAIALYLATSWQYSKSGRGEPNTAQYLGLREQMARALGGTRDISRISDVGKQEMADSFVLQALLVDAYAKAGKSSPATLPKLRASIAQGVRVSFGFDVNALKLTNNGFQL